MSQHHPDPWILALVDALAVDPVIALERRDEPTHALVRTVYAGCGDEAIVAVDLIDSPPPPTAPTYGGFFEDHAYGAPGSTPERPWFVFHRALSVEQNIDRLRTATRDCVFHTGRREAPPACVDEVPDPMEAPRPSIDDMGRTQRRPSQPPAASPSRPPSSPAPAPRTPSSQRAPRTTSPSSHRAPPRRRQAAPEPPPPAPPIAGGPPPVFGGPPASQPPMSAAPQTPPSPMAHTPPSPMVGGPGNGAGGSDRGSRRPPPRRSSMPPPPVRRPPSAPIPGPPPVPGGSMNGPASSPAPGLPPPPPPPRPPFGEDEV